MVRNINGVILPVAWLCPLIISPYMELGIGQMVPKKRSPSPPLQGCLELDAVLQLFESFFLKQMIRQFPLFVSSSPRVS